METPPTTFQNARVLSRRISFIANTLFISYLAIVLGKILPLQLLNPVWQLKSIAAILDSAAVPLVGLGIIYLAVYLDPENSPLQQRASLFARLAIAACIGFLLLVPLQFSAAWRNYNVETTINTRQYRTAASKLADFKQLVANAKSTQEIRAGLLQLNGTPLSNSQLAIPLPQLKQEILSGVDRYNVILARRKPGLSLQQIGLIIQRCFWVLVTAMAYALAFGMGAQSKGSDLSLLDEWLDGFMNWKQNFNGFGWKINGLANPHGPIKNVVDEDYFTKISHKSQSRRYSLSSFRKAIDEATSHKDLQDRLAAIHLPPLERKDLAKPLDKLKQELLSLIDKG